METTFGLIGAIVSLIGFVPYNLAAFRGRAKPNPLSWSTLAVMGFLLTVIISESDGAWFLPAAFTVGRTVTFLTSLKHGKASLSLIEVLSLAGFGFLSIFYALIVGLGLERGEASDPTFLKVCLSWTIVLEFFGALPTLENSFKTPWDENLFGWICFGVGSLISMTQVNITFWEMLYPTWALLLGGGPLCLIFLGLLHFKKWLERETSRMLGRACSLIIGDRKIQAEVFINPDPNDFYRLEIYWIRMNLADGSNEVLHFKSLKGANSLYRKCKPVDIRKSWLTVTTLIEEGKLREALDVIHPILKEHADKQVFV